MEGQLTLNQWVEIKEDIRKRLQQTTENFVVLGYQMKKIRDTKAYEQDGCSSISEWAIKEYGLDKTAISRFIAINDKFSEDGNSMILKKEFSGLGSSKLAEMLTLPETDYTLISKQTPIKEIREIKQFANQEVDLQVDGECEDGTWQQSYNPIEKCIIDYFSNQEKRDALNNVCKMMTDEVNGWEKKSCAEINPTEHATNRKGIIYLFLYDFETGVKYKTLGKTETTELSWFEFLKIVFQIYVKPKYDPQITDYWCEFYGPVVEEKAEEKPITKTPTKPADTQKQKKTEKPVQPVNKINQTKEDILKQLDSPIEELEGIEEVEQEPQEEEVIELDELENEDISISEEVAAVIESLEEPIPERNTSAWQYALQEALAAVKTKHYIMAENYTKNAMEECQKYMNGCDTSRNQDNSESHAE